MVERYRFRNRVKGGELVGLVIDWIWSEEKRLFFSLGVLIREKKDLGFRGR